MSRFETFLCIALLFGSLFAGVQLLCHMPSQAEIRAVIVK